ncbi:MAG: dUTP diphosphatase, partial [Phascolarctobacterium sp.]|nr:dUTP diphosphatase [Phascolarctobacterium sp.]
MEIPEGYHAEIYPRSSVGLNSLLRMANSVGIIDCDYRGEVGFIGESQNGNIVRIEKGQRIAQLIIKKNEDVDLVEVDELSDTERGSGGFGSTGKN